MLQWNLKLLDSTDIPVEYRSFALRKRQQFAIDLAAVSFGSWVLVLLMAAARAELSVPLAWQTGAFLLPATAVCLALAVVWRSGFGRGAAVSSAHVAELHQLLGGGAKADPLLGDAKAENRATAQLLAQAASDVQASNAAM